MSTESTLGDEIRSTSNDACLMSLKQNWSAIIWSSALEILDWTIDLILEWVDPFLWFIDAIGWIPFIGGTVKYLLRATFDTPFRVSWKSTYA